MKNFQIRLNCFVVQLIQSFEDNVSNLFWSCQVIWTNFSHEFCGNEFILFNDQLINAFTAHKQNLLFFCQFSFFLINWFFNQTRNTFQQCTKVRVCVNRANWVFSLCDINFKGRLCIKEIIHEMLDNLLFQHVFNLNRTFGGKLVPKFKVIAEFSPTLRNSWWQQIKQMIKKLENSSIAFRIRFQIQILLFYNVRNCFSQKRSHICSDLGLRIFYQ